MANFIALSAPIVVCHKTCVPTEEINIPTSVRAFPMLPHENTTSAVVCGRLFFPRRNNGATFAATSRENKGRRFLTRPVCFLVTLSRETRLTFDAGRSLRRRAVAIPLRRLGRSAAGATVLRK